MEILHIYSNDTCISKVHQLNQICDFKYLSCEPGCLTFFIFITFLIRVFSESGRFLKFHLNAHSTLFVDYYVVAFFSSTIQVYIDYVVMDKRVRFIFEIVDMTIFYLIFFIYLNFVF